MRPIPRAMLTHTATLANEMPDTYGSGALTPVASLTRVRVEPSCAMVQTRENTRVQLTALLLYDARHSLPQKLQFVAGQRILFEGRAYRVLSVEPMYDGQRLHHVEVGLGG